MNNTVELRLSHYPWRYATGRVAIPGVKLREGTPWQIRAGDRVWRLHHIRPEEGPPEPTAFARFAGEHRGEDSLPFVLAPYIRRDIRTALERSQISYLDYRGNVHLAAPGVLVHLRAPMEEQRAHGLGLAGRRAAQTVLEQKEHAWGVTELARAARVSAGLAQSVMKLLDGNDLLITEGRGPARKRRVREPTRFLDWLAAQEPKRRPRAVLQCSLYARTAEDLVRRVNAALGPRREYALTGAAAAAILGAGATSVPETAIRIAPGLLLQEAANRVGADVSDRGSNLVLWSDEGFLATGFSRAEHGGLLAPNVRIYIDTLLDRRGEDIAAGFREQVLGY